MSHNPSENPFVYDPLMFAKSNESLQFVWIHRLHLLNGVAGGFVSGLLTLLVLYLILCRTPPPYRPYSRILLFTLSVDLMHTIVVPYWSLIRVRIVNKCFIVAFVGAVSLIRRYDVHAYTICVASAIVVMSCTMLLAQCYYRYRFICSGHHPSTSCALRYFAFSFTLGMSCGFGFYRQFLYSANPAFDYGQFWYPEVPIPILMIADFRDVKTAIVSTYAILVTAGSYILSIVLLCRTIFALKTQLNIDHNLQLQTLAPLFGGVIPILSAFSNVAFNVDLGHRVELTTLVVAWFPAFNSASTLIFIVPYRRYCVSMLTGRVYPRSSSFTNSQNAQKRDTGQIRTR